MAQNTKFRFGPVALTNTYTTNILNPGTTTGGVACTGTPWDKLYLIIYHLRVVNKTAGAVTFRLYIGATGANAAGTEVAFDISVPANSEYNIPLYGGIRLNQADFLVGGASALTSLVIEGHGEIGVGA